MQTRRDQLQAYRFVTTRVQSALLHGEPDAPETPMRRIGVAMISGIMVAVLVATGFGIIGFLKPGGKQGWTDAGTLVVEKETGTRYVYIQADGALHPVLNYASARLILNAPTITVRYFSRKSLASVPRGLPRGIAGLPDSLPDANGLVGGPWTVCSRPAAEPGKPAGMTVSVAYPTGGQHVDTGHSLLVKTRTNEYLIWNDHKLKIDNDAIVALHYTDTLALQVADSWVNSLPVGPDVRAPFVPAIGSPAPDVGGSSVRVGRVFRVPTTGNAPPTYWVALQDGLAQTTETDSLLLLASKDVGLAYPNDRPHYADLNSGDLVSAARSTHQLVTAGFPPTLPVQLNPQASNSQVVCSAYTNADGSSTDVTVSLANDVPGARPQTNVTVGLGTGQTADQVLLPPGTAAVVRELLVENQPSDAMYVVTDAGGKYGVPSADVLNNLGYGGVTPHLVPKRILDLIPRGPALDPQTVNTEMPVPGNSVQLPINPQQQGGGGG